MVVNDIENIEIKELNEVIEPVKEIKGIKRGRDNKDLNVAKRNKMDEFYTQMTDIEKELKHYKEHFKDKVIFCNCDDPQESNFWRYFYLNFDHIGLKKIISTHYDYENPTYKLEYDGEDLIKIDLKGNGDFRSPECVELLKESDIIITNPPFSLFREYVAQLVEYNKKFIIIGNLNTIGCKEIFPLLKENKMWLGCSIHSGDREFKVPNHYPLDAAGFRVDNDGNKYIRIKGVRWFTNIDYKERHEDLILYKKYNEEEYPKYDNYNAINVDKTKDIPIDYDGEIGVPITFIDKYNPDQFEIIGIARPLVKKLTGKVSQFRLNGKELYFRIVIKRKVRKILQL
jgi:hypothetical protein